MNIEGTGRFHFSRSVIHWSTLDIPFKIFSNALEYNYCSLSKIETTESQ